MFFMCMPWHPPLPPKKIGKKRLFLNLQIEAKSFSYKLVDCKQSWIFLLHFVHWWLYVVVKVLGANGLRWSLDFRYYDCIGSEVCEIPNLIILETYISKTRSKKGLKRLTLELHYSKVRMGFGYAVTEKFGTYSQRGL